MLANKTGELTLVEVKSLSNQWSLPYRVSLKQRARLEKCRMLCENQFQMPTQILYVYVYKEDVIVLD